MLPAMTILRGSRLRKKKRSASSQFASGEMSLGFRELNTASRGRSVFRPPLPKRTAGQSKDRHGSAETGGRRDKRSPVPPFARGGKFSHLNTLTPASRNSSACFRHFSHRLAFRAGKDSRIQERKSLSVLTPAPASRLNRLCCSAPWIFNRFIKALAARTQ